MTYRTRSITIASGLAMMAFILTVLYVSGYKQDVERQGANTLVYVAVKDIPPGTPGAALLKDKLVKALQVPRREAVSGFVGKPRQVANLVVSQPIYAGEQLNLKRFATKGEEGAPASISGRLRAYQLPGDRNQLLAGTLKPGDRVDVVATVEYPTARGTIDVSKVVLRGILVLDVSTSTSGGKVTGGDDDEGSALLALTDAQSQKLHLVATNGAWTLDLRPGHKARDSKPSVETPQSIILDDLSPAARARLASAVAE